MRMVSFLVTLFLLITSLFSTPLVHAASMPDATWTSEFTPTAVGPLAMVQEYEGVLYGFSNGQFFRSLDDGETWQKRSMLFAHRGLEGFLVVNENVWVVKEGPFSYYTNDAGLTWAVVNHPNGWPIRFLRHGGHILALVPSFGKTQNTILSESPDGKTWSELGRIPAQATDLCMGTSSDQLYAYTSKQERYLSTDGGKTWSSTPSTAQVTCTKLDGKPTVSGDYQVEQPDRTQFFSRVFRLADGQLYATTDMVPESIYRRNAAGEWEKIRTVPEGLSKAYPLADGSALWAIAKHQVYQSKDGGATWEAIPLNLGQFAPQWVRSFPDSTMVVSLYYHDGDLKKPAYQLSITRDSGKTWVNRSSPLCRDHFSNGGLIACSRATDERVTLYTSNNDGITWNEFQLPEPAAFAGGTLFGDGRSIYYESPFANRGIWKTADAGRTWSRISSDPRGYTAMPTGDLIRYATGFTNPREGTMDLSQRVEISRDGGSTWLPVEADAMASQTFALSPDEIYGWTERGLGRLQILPALTDLKGHWAERYVKRLVGFGVVGGNPDGTFRPDEPISRAALVKLLVTAANLRPVPEEPNPFRDAAGHWATEAGYIGAALKEGILRATEYPGGNLKPDDSVTRAEMARLLVRTAGIAENPAVKDPALFSDSSQIPLGLRPHVMLAVQEGLLTGIRGNDGTLTFDPEGDVTRAQAAVVILRLMARWQ